MMGNTPQDNYYAPGQHLNQDNYYAPGQHLNQDNYYSPQASLHQDNYASLPNTNESINLEMHCAGGGDPPIPEGSQMQIPSPVVPVRGGSVAPQHGSQNTRPPRWNPRRNAGRRQAVNLGKRGVFYKRGYNNESQQTGGTVEYLNKSQRNDFEVTVGDGGLYWGQTPGQPFSTRDLKTCFSGNGWGIWVLSLDNRFYSNRHEKDVFHHSSFLGGAPVRCGGEWKVVGGKIECITGKTGHYKSNVKALVYALHMMVLKGANLDDSMVQLWGKEDAPSSVDIGGGKSVNVGLSGEALEKSQSHQKVKGFASHLRGALSNGKWSRQAAKRRDQIHANSTKLVPVNEFLFNQEYRESYQAFGYTTNVTHLLESEGAL